MKIGWIGTGVMGTSMAGHVLEAGYDLYVHNRTKTKSEDLLNSGARWCDSPVEVAENSEIVFTIVGYPKDVKEVYLGDRGILQADGPCTVLVDMTTSQPSLAHTIATESAIKGIDSLDAPVSGGDVGAKGATLAIMVGEKGRPFKKSSLSYSSWGKQYPAWVAPAPGSTPRCAIRYSSPEP